MDSNNEIKQQTSMPHICSFCILFSLLALTATAAWSQAVSATFWTVTDASGAVVSNAGVTTETQASATRTEQTNESGNHNVPNPPSGVYSVAVDAAVFKNETRRDITLGVDTTTRVEKSSFQGKQRS